MGLFDLIGKIAVGVVVAVVILSYFGFYETEETTVDNAVESTLSEVQRAQPYIDTLSYNDTELRKLAIAITKDCPTNDKECQTERIFRYTVDNNQYYLDPRDSEHIQTPQETLLLKGGDCEDFTILMNSLLESIGVKTYFVMTDTHAYGLVCNVDPARLRKYVDEGLLRKYAQEASLQTTDQIIYENGTVYRIQTYQEEITLESSSTYYYGGDGTALQQPIINKQIEYSIAFSGPIDFYVIPSKKDYYLLADGKSFDAYTACTQKNIRLNSDVCTIDVNGGIAITNNGNRQVKGTIDITIKQQYSSYELLKDTSITYYQKNNETCVTLDGTSGEYGYPGYNPANLTGQRIAIDPVTLEIIYLK